MQDDMNEVGHSQWHFLKSSYIWFFVTHGTILRLSGWLKNFVRERPNLKAQEGCVGFSTSFKWTKHSVTIHTYIHTKVLQLMMDGPSFCWIWKKEDLWRVINFTWASSGWVLVRRRSRPPWLACSCLRSHSYVLPAECTEKKKHMNFGISPTRIVSVQKRNIQCHRYPN